MLHLIALYAALIDPRWEVRESAEQALVRLVDRHPAVYGPRLGELAREATEPEVLARCRRPLIVYARHRALAYVPATVPVWPICDAMQAPDGSRDKLTGMPWYWSTQAGGAESGPYWHRYRRATEMMARDRVLHGASYAEADALLARMWAVEKSVQGDCLAAWPAESAKWTKWEGGYPCPK